MHYTLIGAGAVIAAAALGVGVSAPYIHKLFKQSFGRSDPAPDGQNAFLDGLRAKGFDKQVEIVQHGWNRLASTAHEKVYITSHVGYRLCAKLFATFSLFSCVGYQFICNKWGQNVTKIAFDIDKM